MTCACFSARWRAAGWSVSPEKETTPRGVVGPGLLTPGLLAEQSYCGATTALCQEVPHKWTFGGLIH